MATMKKRFFGLSVSFWMLVAAPVAAQLGPEFVRASAPVPGAEISYLVRNASGPALVLIPGSLVGAEDWSGVVAGLDPRIKVVLIELRGHGQSWPPPEHGTIPQFAQDVLAAVKHAGLERFYLGGHSIGGMVAIEAAQQFPQRLEGVIAIEGWTHFSVAVDAFQQQNDKTLSPAQRARLAELRAPVMTRWKPEQIKDFQQIWHHWNGYAILEKTPLPVLEVWGDRNRPIPSRQLMKIPDRPNISMIWIHGASHFLPLERPAEVAAAINGFIQHHSARHF